MEIKHISTASYTHIPIHFHEPHHSNITYTHAHINFLYLSGSDIMDWTFLDQNFPVDLCVIVIHPFDIVFIEIWNAYIAKVPIYTKKDKKKVPTYARNGSKTSYLPLLHTQQLNYSLISGEPRLLDLVLFFS